MEVFDLGTMERRVFSMATTWEVKGTTATYLVDGETAATIKGLKSGLTVKENGTIDGIVVGDDGTITLDKSVLNRKKVTITNAEDSDTTYSLAVADNCAEHSGSAWAINGTTADLLGGTSEYYAVESGDIVYNAPEIDDSITLATISGLSTGDFDKTDVGYGYYEIDGIDVTEDDNTNVITIKVTDKAVLGEDGLTLTAEDLSDDADYKDLTYKLAVGTAVQPQALAPTWKNNNGTATFTSTMSKGYELTDDNTISLADPGSVEVVVKGVNARATNEQLAEIFEVSGTTITVNNSDVLTKSVSIATSGYTFEAGSDFKGESEVGDATWSQAAGKMAATYSTTIGNGYYFGGNTITHYSATTGSTPVTLFTLSGLPKNTDSDAITTEPKGVTLSGNVITVDSNLLNLDYESTDGFKAVKDEEGNSVYGVQTLSLGKNDNYTLALASDDLKPQADAMGKTWNVGKKASTNKTTKETTYTGTGSITLDLSTSHGWKVDESTKKTISYVAPVTTNYTTISGIATALCDTTTGELSSDYELETKTVDGEEVYTGNILYVGGDATDTDDDEKNYALEIREDTDGNPTVFLGESILTTGKVTIKNNTKNPDAPSYGIALAEDVHEVGDQEPYWSVTSGGKATLIGGKTDGYSLITDKKTGAVTGINYTKAVPTTLATITIKGYLNDKGKVELEDSDIAALEEKLDAATTLTKNTDGTITGGTITLNGDILDGTSTAEDLTGVDIQSLTLASGKNYSFKFGYVTEDSATGTETAGDADETAAPTAVAVYGIDTTATPEWTVTSKETKTGTVATGTATYDATMLSGYVTNETSATFKLGGASTLITLSGLDAKNKSVEELQALIDGSATDATDDDSESTVPDEAVTVDGKEVKINNIDLFGGNKISLDKVAIAGGYTLNTDNVAIETIESPEWVYDTKKKTWGYQTGKTAGYTADEKNGVKTGTATYTAASASTTDILTTITGLGSDIDVADVTINGTRVKITDEMLQTATGKTVSISGDYSFMAAGFSKAGISYGDADTTNLNSKGTITFSRTVEEGWELATGNKAINQVAAEDNKLAVTISGLNKNADADNIEDYIEFNESNNTIKILDSAILTSSNVTAKSANSTTYKLALDDAIAQETTEGVTAWVNSKGTASLQTYDTDYYTYDTAKNTVVYHKATNVKSTASIKGLNTAIDGAAVDEYIHLKDNVITIDDEALFGLATGTTATAKTVVQLTNAKAKGTVEATDYKLALKDSQKVVYDDPKFEAGAKDGQAIVVKGVSTAGAGYEVDSTGLKLSYIPDEVTVKGGSSVQNTFTLATLTGIYDAGGLSFKPVEDEGDDEEESATDTTTTTSNVIVVSNAALSGKAVSIDKTGIANGYTLELDETSVATEAEISGESGTTSKGVYTLKGDVEGFYTQTSTTAISYTAAKNNQTLVTIKGLSTDANIDDPDDKIITISGSDVATSAKSNGAITVDSAYGYKFSFDDTYSGTKTLAANITGGKNVDNIGAAGSNLLISTAAGADNIIAIGENVSINAGAGDDVISFTESTGSEDAETETTTTTSTNVLMYKVGDGNDTVTGFDAANDKINLTAGSEKVTVAADGADAVVNITDSNGTAKTAGSITLVGLADKLDSIKNAITGNAKKPPTVVTETASSADLASSADVIADNYFDASPQLSDILGTSADAVSTDNFSATPDYTKLAATQTMAYSGEKK